MIISMKRSALGAHKADQDASLKVIKATSEMKMKEEAGMSSRCMPLKQEHLGDVCPICGKPAKKMIYWGVAY